jgi:hypothetical protein
MSFSHRVAARYQAQLDDGAQQVLDRWADMFLGELGKVKIKEKDVSKLLKSQGITPEDINSLDGGRQAGDFIPALGGWVKKGLWYLLVRPFLVVGKLVKSGQFRKEVKAAFRRELSHDVRATRHMLRVARKIAAGESVKPQEKKAAIKQFVSVMTRAVLVVMGGPTASSLFSGSVWKALGGLMVPAQELLVMLLYRPMQSAAGKLMTAPMG